MVVLLLVNKNTTAPPHQTGYQYNISNPVSRISVYNRTQKKTLNNLKQYDLKSMGVAPGNWVNI